MRADPSREGGARGDVSGLEHQNKQKQKGGRSLGGMNAGSPGLVPSSSFYLIGPLSRINVVAALIEIEGVDGQQPFGLFHLLGGAETPSPTERREKEEDERSQERKFPQITECFRHSNRLSEHRLTKRNCEEVLCLGGRRPRDVVAVVFESQQKHQLKLTQDKQTHFHHFIRMVRKLFYFCIIIKLF